MPGLLVGAHGGYTNPYDFTFGGIAPNASRPFTAEERATANELGAQGNWASDLGDIGRAAATGIGSGLLVGAGGYLGAEGLAALGAGGGAAAGAAMPAAQALAPEAIAEMGLTELSPGVFTNAGNAAAFGSLGAAAQPLGLPGQVGAAPDVAAGPSVSGPAPLSGPGAPPPPPAGATPPPPPAAPSFTDSLLKQMKDNALSLGLMGLGTAASLSAGRPQIPNQQQLQGLNADAQATAHQLLTQYQSGALNPNQQASLDQLTQNTKNQLRNYFASIGQSDSTAAVQAMAQVDQTAMGMKQQMLDTALQQGLTAIGVAQGPLNSIAQYQLGQDAQLRQAFGNFAGGVGQLFGRNSGVPQPTKPVTSASVQQPVSSLQSTPPELG